MHRATASSGGDAVPHYYFDTYDGRDVLRDEEGQDCDTIADAEREAEEAVRELVAAAVVRHVAMDSREMRVRDAGDTVVLVLRFRDVLEG